MNTNKVSGMWNNGTVSPKTTTKKTTTTKKKFDKEGKVVSETVTVYEETVTTYDYPNYVYTTNSPGTMPLGEVTYK